MLVVIHFNPSRSFFHVLWTRGGQIAVRGSIQEILQISNILQIVTVNVSGEANLHWLAVAYLGYGRHDTCNGRHFDGGAKIAWQKLKSLCIVSWTSILRPMPGT